jgi:gliding motility-associated-like protein
MRKIVLFIFILFTVYSSKASHFIGGEITWQCDTDPVSPNYGRYTFYLTIYQDCDGINFYYGTCAEDLTVHNLPGLTQICMNFLDTNDISSSGVSGAQPCYDCDNQPNNQFGAVREWLYVSDPITLNGTPPAGGWHFTWGSCCRSSNLTQGMNDDDWTIRSVMYAYTDPTGTVFPNGNVCHDNSPIFKEDPKLILCTGYPFSFSHLAFDVELDSLSYSWAEPLGANFSYNAANPSATALLFNAPYTVNAPIPGNPTLNNENGEISFLSNTAGIFVTCVKVAAYKCGQLVAEVFRDVNVALISCGTLPNGAQNLPPVITPPLGPQDWLTNFSPSTGLPSYETTVMAGELVSFSVVATDADINATGGMQNLSLEVEGGQLDPLLAVSNVATFTVTSSAPGNIAGDFLWQSNCDHMQDYGCGRQGGAYTFNLKSYDDFCPANGIVIATITINVIPPQPDLRCLAVDSSGGVDLFYSFPQGVVDTNIKYDIYHSKNIGGPFEIIDSTFFPDTNYYHLGSDADNSKSYYFLLGTVTCGTNLGAVSDSLLYSDTLTTILMNATTINFGLTADLNWNPIHDPLLPSSFSNYDVHCVNSNNTDNIIVSTPDLFCQMDGDNCDYFPKFYVEIPDVSGCVSKSSIATVNLKDTVSPITPIIKDISVDNSGKSVVSWLPSIGADLYIVYLQDLNGAWITLDTVSSFFNSYVYQNSIAVNNSENFSIRAIDTCGNSRVRSLTHNSIYLSNGSNACDQSISLYWNDYINWAGVNLGISHYTVLITETDPNGAVINTSFRVESTSQLLIENLSSLANYSIVVEAYNVDSTFKAVSNTLNVNITLAEKPLFNYIEYASINHDDGSVDLSCIVDVLAVIDRYDVYRSLRKSDSFSKVGEVSFSGSSPIYFNDNNALTNEFFYQYEIHPVDTCGVSLAAPPVNMPEYLYDTSFAQTILLEAEINVDYSQISSLASQYTNTLVFNNYDKWLGEVSEYRLYRSINREPYNLIPLYVWDRSNEPNEELKYIDIVTEFGSGNGRFCYYIQAVEGLGSPYGPVLEGSLSNVTCVSQTPVIHVSNTFTPNGDEHNEIFRPVTYFVSEQGYSFSIYNRQGEKIFFTDDPQKGWDGSYNGNQVQNGNYVYHLQFLNGVGDLTEKKDFITLVR